MEKYRKKPVIIEAAIWDGKRQTLELLESCGMKTGRSSSWAEGHPRHNEISSLGIKTLEGTMTVNLGDYIIKGIKGEFYPCKSDIFEASYDKAETFARGEK